MEDITITCRYEAGGDSLEQVCALCLWLLMSQGEASLSQ